MEKFIKTTKKIIFNQQKDIVSSALILSFMIIISRFFGIFRYRILTHFFPPEELDIFIASFRLPDFIFEILITGALSSAFIPIFIKYEKDKKILHRNISSIINILSIILFIFITVIFVLADYLVPLITPGFTNNPQKIEAIITFSRILLLTQLPFLVFGSILSGMAQANKIFVITAIAPILYNLGVIIGTIVLAKSFWIYGPIIGVSIGAILFFIVQLPTIFIIDFRFIFALEKKVIREFANLFLPRVLSVITTQIDLTIDLILSTLLSPGSYTIFFFSQHLHFFPVSFFGMSYAQASLPYLSDLFEEKKIAEIRKIFIDSLVQLLFLTVPLAFFFIFARTPIVRIFFGGKEFDFAATNQTALTLSYFSLSIPSHSIFYFLTRSFYATHDTKTPFILNFISVIINIILSLLCVFVFRLPVWSLAMSFSLSISINTVLLFVFFHRKIGGLDIYKFIKNTVKIYFASFAASAVAYPLMKLLDVLVLNTTRTINVFILIATSFGAFILVYLFVAWFINIEEIYILGKLLVKMKEIKRKLTEVYADIG